MLEIINDAVIKDKTTKIVLFSSSKRTLKFLKMVLDKKEICNNILHGEHSAKHRQLKTDNFKKDNHSHVFLVSLKTAGIGVTLTEATIVIEFDSWWNSSSREQAIHRVYRPGQTKPVTVYRFLSNTVFDESINHLIEKKATLFNTLCFFMQKEYNFKDNETYLKHLEYLVNALVDWRKK